MSKGRPKSLRLYCRVPGSFRNETRAVVICPTTPKYDRLAQRSGGSLRCRRVNLQDAGALQLSGEYGNRGALKICHLYNVFRPALH